MFICCAKMNFCVYLLVFCAVFINTKADFYSYYECNEPLLHRAELKATSYLRERGPQNAVLNGKWLIFKKKNTPNCFTTTKPPPQVHKKMSATRVRWCFNFNSWNPSAAELLFATSCIQVEEKERIGRFIFKKDFKASLIGRLLMRKFVSEFAGIAYSEIKFVRDERGKPCVQYPLVGDFQKVSFNVSHHGNFCVLAGEMGDIQLGVDVVKVERPVNKDLREYFRIMYRQFAVKEWETIKGEPDEKSQLAMYYRHWCLKESYVKALGVGITINLQNLCFKINTKQLKENEIVTNTKLEIQGEVVDWLFEESLLDKSHCVAVALQEKNVHSNAPAFTLLNFSELMRNASPVIAEDDDYCKDFFVKE